MLLVLGACSRHSPPPPPPPEEATIVHNAVVGTKTDLFEVAEPNALRLVPGARAEPVNDPNGGPGFLLRRANGEIGGYVYCCCVGATTSTCKTESDNPNYPACSGACTDSEGNAHGCMISDPLPGPPKTPLKFLARK
jgi:hypothetical protein